MPKLTIKDVGMILSNPFYCLGKGIDPTFCIPHEPLITEKMFIKGGVKMIKEIGAEKYIKYILENLKGNSV